MNSKKVETIKVKHKDGYMIINKNDFDKDKHEEYLDVNKDNIDDNKQKEEVVKKPRKKKGE